MNRAAFDLARVLLPFAFRWGPRDQDRQAFDDDLLALVQAIGRDHEAMRAYVAVLRKRVDGVEAAARDWRKRAVDWEYAYGKACEREAALQKKLEERGW